MEISQFLLFTLVILAFGLIGFAFVPVKLRASFSILILFINVILTTIPSILALTGCSQTGTLVLSHFSNTIVDIRIDSLSAWFILIINFTTLNGALFGSGYLKSYSHMKTNLNMHWIFYMLFHISMVWVCMFEHGILFIISWELMLISSLMLVIFEYNNAKNLRAGLKYLIHMHISVALLTIGFIWVFVETGSFNFSALAQVTSHNHAIWIFILFFIGFAIKAGFLPFHTWLPDADSTGPSHVAGVMSGVIVKLGIFGILRIVSYMPYDLFIIGEIILSLSILTALYGIINAAVKYDFNRSLAYCTMENIGIIGMGIGLGVMGMGSNQPLLILLGFSGALLHVLNHSLFKSLLFFSTGSVYQQTRTRSIEKLGGLIKTMPVTAVFFLIGAMAIGGLPPFNGFVSEFLIYSGLFKSLFAIKGISNVILIVLSIAGLVLVGGISIVTFTKLFGVIFLGKARHTFKQTPKETGFIMHLPQYLIVGVIISVALFPRFYLQQSVKIIDATFNSGISIDYGRLSSTYTSLEHVGRISLFFISFVLGLFALRTFFLKKRPKSVQETWACAYSSPVLKAQYSGRSYTRNFGILFGSLIKERRCFNEIPKRKIYPHSRKFSTSYFDFFELYLVTPLLKRISWVINYFQFIQNGRIQSYLIYSLVFIVIVFIGTAIGLIK